MTRGRYAPSPTGDLHLGNLRTAVLAWLFAHSPIAEPVPKIPEPVEGHELLYRIEDLDASRVRPGIADRQRADLESLGLSFDPPTLLQSERLDAYQDALQTLADRAYPCFCSRREIAEAASAPHATPGRYPGTCRELSTAQRAERARTRPSAIRLRAEAVPVTVTDLLHGQVSGVPDDIVLRRNDGVASYNLAVVVDDSDSGIDQVVRGDDLLDSAISQSYLAGLLGRPAPTYAHVPLALNADGRRLAKRDGAVTLTDLAAQGIAPPQVLTMIAESLDLAEADSADPGEPATLDRLLERFDPAALPHDPWVVSPVTSRP